MELPPSLPTRAYLLTYDLGKQRLRYSSRLGYLVRAAALEDLRLRERLTDAGDRPRATGGPVGDPVLDAVLDEIATRGKPRSWKHWVRKNHGSTRRAVRDQLEVGGWIRVEPRRILGVIPRDRVVVRDHRVAKELVTTAGRTLTGSTPVTTLGQREVALATLAAMVELNTVCSGSQRRQHRRRIQQLLALSGPALPALKKVIRDDTAAAAG
jgi:hypothetical protein